jgi:UDP-N-acetylglucosamine 4,6-dehydratase
MSSRLQARFAALPFKLKRALTYTGDLMLFPIALWLAFSVQQGVWFSDVAPVAGLFVLLPVFTFIVYTQLGLYRAIIRYLGWQALLVIGAGAVVSALSLGGMLVLTHAHYDLVTLPVIYGLFLSVLIGGSRVLFWSFVSDKPSSNALPVVVYGAGMGGRQLVNLLRSGGHFWPVAFFDDKAALHGRYIEGIEVIDPRRHEMLVKLKSRGVKDVFLCIPSASRFQRRKILNLLEPLAFHIRTVPALDEIISGNARLDEFREIQIEDLLGREAVPPHEDLLERCIRGKTVLVTGAAGSIGTELCLQVINLGARKLVLLDHSEYGLYRVEAELRQHIKQYRRKITLVPLLGSVTDAVRMENVFATYAIDTVYHAAAYKHVPLVEHNPLEGLKVNAFGTYITADCARRHQVSDFVLISTDKAVRPTNVMGASKRLAEMVLQAMQHEGGKTTVFSMVRFGNVLGSSGSVVPLFHEQILHGGPLTVTHPEITRFFMTIPEAVQLVIQAGALAEGGDVFVLDMGEPVKIADLARHMIRLSGLEVCDDEHPDGDIEIVYTGLRPGEKLYEELLIGEDVSGTEHPKIMRAMEEMLPMGELMKRLDILRAAMEKGDQPGIRSILLECVKGYKPADVIEDHVWVERNAVGSAGVTVH